MAAASSWRQDSSTFHNHSTTALLEEPAAETQVAQGITTIVVGADGSSPWPITE